MINTISADSPMPESSDPQDVLYQSERTIIYRARIPDRAESVICKEPLGQDASKRLKHEYSILKRLAAVNGVPHLITGTVPTRVLVLEDAGGLSIGAFLRAGLLDISKLLDLAIETAEVLAAVHRAGVLHKDINPANILLSGPKQQPILIDFDLATTFAEQRPSFAAETAIAGTLAYMAPEQTGRTGRTVDQRADLYSLGVTFYELATGLLPFETTDPLQLLHDHLA